MSLSKISDDIKYNKNGLRKMALQTVFEYQIVISGEIRTYGTIDIPKCTGMIKY